MEYGVRTGRRIRRAGAALALALLATVVVGHQASAHDFSLSGSIDRECGDDQPWSATVTATTAEALGSPWVTSYQIDDGEFSPRSDRQPDSEPYVYEIGPFDAARSEVRMTVDAIWYNQPGNTKRTSSITLQRPAEEQCPGPTPSTTVPPTMVTPEAPEVGYDCVTDDIVVNGADDTDEIDYTITVDTEPDGDGSPWAVTITAAPAPGYDFPPDATTEWTFSGTVTCGEQVEISAPVEPTISYDCELADFVGPDDTDEIDYTITIDTAPNGFGSVWEITVTATPRAGFVFPPGATTEWAFSGTDECAEIIPGPPFPTPAGRAPVEFDCVTQELVITGADDTAQIDFTVTIGTAPAGEGSVWDVTITATAKPGFEFADGATTEWNYTGTVQCVESGVSGGPPVKPAVTYDCATESFVGADDTDEVDYTVTIDTAPGDFGSIWEITVTAAPRPGVTFPPGATTEWEFFGTTDCTVVLATPAFPVPTGNTPVTFECGTGRLVIVGTDDTDQIDFTVTINTAPAGEGSAWDVTITAAARPGFQFAPGATTAWNYTGTVDCRPGADGLPTSYPDPGAAGARFDCAVDRVVVAGAGDTDQIDYTVTITEPTGEGSRWGVTITAVARPGFTLRDGATTEWNFGGTVDCGELDQASSPPGPGIVSSPPAVQRHPDTGAEHGAMVLIASLLLLAGLACLRLARRDEVPGAPIS